jgi:hypothetical protein
MNQLVITVEDELFHPGNDSHNWVGDPCSLALGSSEFLEWNWMPPAGFAYDDLTSVAVAF